MSLKTLHLTNAWHKSSGGIGTFYRALLEAANEYGHYLVLVVPGEDSHVEQIGAFGRVYYIQAPMAPIHKSYRMLYPTQFLFPKTAIQNILNLERPDLVEVSEKYTMPYLTGLLRIKSLRGVGFRPTTVGLSCERMDENMAAYFSGSRAAAGFCRWYMKWIYFPLFDHHIAVSEHAAAELRPASRGHKVDRGVWIRPMGADCSQFTPERRNDSVRNGLARQCGGSPESRLLVYAGRLAPEKNLPLLIETVSKLVRKGSGADYRLLIAGQGMSQPEMERQGANQAPGAVTFLGHLGDRDRLADLYANADAFVHPNPREPFGIAPLEAMAAGLPLVGPNSGGLTSYANESNAWLTQPDADSFAAALESVWADPATRARRVSAALDTAKRFEWRNVAPQFLRLYADIHARTQGLPSESAIDPQFVSTRGNYLGKEIAYRYNATEISENVSFKRHQK